ncbi:hypothetical protein HYFRA_00009118 [Hymenoscyphus fraxineus]|uniref:Uncharacterized protein n=1 Tax=Hymenoscyphus fraxineus TaxID=746836 RepID=A0A9N9KWA1_9HELO|nr:hypothetical protein HYFRA_00009118 [Hymenoscyphus fraxineus]
MPSQAPPKPSQPTPASQNELVMVPRSQGLYHLSTSGKYYQVTCSIDTAGDTAFTAYPGVNNALECAQKFNTWNAITATNPECFSIRFYLVSPNGHNNRILTFAPASGEENAAIA